jgi:predicted peptidase
MGGGGCWDLAAAAPDVFAAIVPVSGQVRVKAATVARPPAWVFHGCRDRTNSAKEAKDCLGARAHDSRTRLDIDPDAGHDLPFWNAVYRRADLYQWLLEQRLETPGGK